MALRPGDANPPMGDASGKAAGTVAPLFKFRQLECTNALRRGHGARAVPLPPPPTTRSHCFILYVCVQGVEYSRCPRVGYPGVELTDCKFLRALGALQPTTCALPNMRGRPLGTMPPVAAFMCMFVVDVCVVLVVVVGDGAEQGRCGRCGKPCGRSAGWASCWSPTPSSARAWG